MIKSGWTRVHSFSVSSSSLATTMGKSIRSKTKRAYRHKKREDSDFAVTAAARLARLSAKLANAAGVRGEADAEEPAADEAPVDGEGAETTVTEQGEFLLVYAPTLSLRA
jgi:hypothetical protein